MNALSDAKASYRRLYCRLTGRSAAQFERDEWPRLRSLWAAHAGILPAKTTARLMGWMPEGKNHHD